MSVSHRPNFVTILVFAVACMFAFSLGYRANEPTRHIAKVDKVMPYAKFRYPGDLTFAQQVVDSSTFAVVLQKSEFSQANANALEALRSWAGNNFRRDPRFLHPVSLPKPLPNATVLDSAFYGLFHAPYTWLSSQASKFLEERIGQFCETVTFSIFRRDYVELFGNDTEAATLLARYQTERARAAINPLLALLYFAFTLVLAPYAVRFLRELAGLWREAISVYGAKEAAWVSYFSLSLTLFYSVQALVCLETQAASLVTAGVFALLSIFLLFPVKLLASKEELLFLRTSLDGRTVMLIGWMIFSMVCGQCVLWLKQDLLTNLDPLTLVICAFTGNFLTDPLAIKKTLAMGISVAWAVSFAWSLKLLNRRGAASTKEVAKRLASLTPNR
jgi:hypothetical protein